jgi:chemotaxis protein CheX
MIDQIEDLLKSSVSEVFRTMLKTETRVIPMTPDAMSDEPHVAGSVGFIGDLTGVIYIYCTAEFARQVTGILLETSGAEIDSEELINDSMGELANVVVGGLKARLTERGHSCVLTIPSIVRGSHFSIEATRTTTRRVLCFRCQDSVNLVVEILIKPFQRND